MVQSGKNKKTATVIICLNLILFTLLVVDISIFYYKYSNSITYNKVDYQKNAQFLLDKYSDEFESLEKDKDKFQSFLDSGLIGDIYLLKTDIESNLNLLASSNHGDEKRLKRDCEEIFTHNFKKIFYSKQVLPENKINICLFEKKHDYIMGLSVSFYHTVSDSHDSEFKQWVLKNVAPYFILTGVITIFLILAVLWSINRYYDLRAEYIKDKLKLKNELKEIKKQLYIDPLTNLSNKTMLMNNLKKLDKPKVIILDIDDFGVMNDYYGKDICDAILVYIAGLISDFAITNKMKAYCLGADRFALVENGEFIVEKYEDLANELIGRFKGRMTSIKVPNSSDSISIEIHTTIGFSVDEDDTLMKATTALKVAKNTGKDYVCYFKGLNKKDEYKIQIERSLMIRQAIIGDKVLPYYQPIFDRDGNITKYESLIRMINSDEILSPHKFLDVAKRIKRYTELQKKVVEKAIEELSQNLNLVLSVNLSGRDMIDGDVSLTILKLLANNDVADRLIFELVEDENLENVERIEKFIDKVKKMGVRIAIDDFGSGYSNFSYILKLKPDFIKIDGSIIKNIDSSNDSYMITRAIVYFARDLGIKTVAEYIHSADVLDICKKLGVDEFQGFYLGVPSEKVEM
ncbi:diguanylate cyclase/phosphodiesterase [Campylobacter pinnipediorum subsp. caledonicus]|uniref:EAL domain-containing protein n=1 Tax=Campylobacter pinnipediorum TaxID=1965231 RepID=UPI000995AEE7|nr:diguanylate cyclase/phosphodiesterase [Campylobacter pinnipediorum subsp. caledonicus]